MINSFRGEFDFLSNFHILPNPIYWLGIVYSTSEHMFVSFKTNDHAERQWIAGIKYPGQAKNAGGKKGHNGRFITLRANWDQVKVEAMRMTLLLKYYANPGLIYALCATHPKLLVEGNTWHDNIWGNCTCARCAHIPGQNLLGHLHIEHRHNFITLG